jgi:hypothetical protein
MGVVVVVVELNFDFINDDYKANNRICKQILVFRS